MACGADQRPAWASGPAGAEKWAVTDRFVLIATVQVPVPLQPPLQPVNAWPGAEAAVSVTLAWLP